MKAAQQREFLAVSDRLRAEALAKGMDFQETAPRYMVPKVRYEEQYAVLIGGWPTMDAARKELDAIRRWQPPKDATLMDQAYVVRPGSGAGEKTFVNPFQAAFVTRNPVAPKVLDAEGRADPLVLRMNEAEELSVLKIQKPWTIVVKSFFVPIQEIRDKDASRSIFSKLFNAKQDTLSATAQQARALAQVLRQTQPRPLEAYVLHTLNGSLVCVGQFDAPDDPALLETQRHLETLTFDERREKAGPVVGHRRMFDQLVAMRVK